MQIHNQKAEPVSYRPDDAASVMGVSRRTVDRWTREGKIRATKVGRMILIPATEVHAIVAGGE